MLLQELNTSLNQIIQQFKWNIVYLECILVLLWGMYFLTILTHRKLLCLGIIPRHLVGLPGILFAPLLHAHFNHLFFNSIPLIILSNFILINGLHDYLYITFFITIVSGFLTWCFAKPGIHVGASGVITGYWTYLVFNIYQQGTLTAIILGIVCLYYFIGIFYAIFPSERGVSWEGHLFGGIAGVLASKWAVIFL